MGDDFFIVDILIFAAITGFLIYRFKNILGTKHGEERKRPNMYDASADHKKESNVVNLKTPKRSKVARLSPDFIKDDYPQTVAGGLQKLQDLDPYFNEHKFLKGVRAAYKMIVQAFAQGDDKMLAQLLSKTILEQFKQAIKEREESVQTLEITIHEISEIDIVKIDVTKNYFARIGVKIHSKQVSIMRDELGEILDGDPDKPVEVEDYWVFEKEIQSKDPNWVLIETRES